ncbi:DUF1405 domain-containing protein [Alkalihalobacillus pseudalcaliphilus]|uniref:DUF1405 domain-containing protein n=1 Tax=Alkalihalobacillus pseudalcaliphilus TaxID=79884 RepID=UPI00064DF6A3|nr:DUF1405 domain-containing protein [Alkalihalobacillus pseudalcaliphilus]KMK76420.1 membrane protein [Alkalihalobacillus pseudalcaliphilus]
MLKQILTMFGHRSMLILLLVINIPGTIYGFYWYWGQLQHTPPQFLIFVPDSPTASLFFVFVLIAFLWKKNWPIIEALAAVTLIKYGIWAVVMNMATGFLGGSLNWQHYMLIASHAGMALQAVIYSPYFRIKAWHLVVAAIWTLHNDFIDYFYGMHPYLSSYIMPHIDSVMIFTVSLSIFSIVSVYFLSVRKKSLKLSIDA